MPEFHSAIKILRYDTSQRNIVAQQTVYIFGSKDLMRLTPQEQQIRGQSAIFTEWT